MVRNPSNPKRHSTQLIGDSVRRFGWIESLTLDERDGSLISGHGRADTMVDMLAQARQAGHEPPDGVRVEPDGEWSLPVTRGWSSADDREQQAALVALNRGVEVGGWDDRALADILSNLSGADGGLSGVGYDDSDLQALLAGLGGQVGLQSDPDEIPPEPAVPITQPGDLWLLGDHRLLCGDSTVGEDVKRLLDGAQPRLMVTDPPYGVTYDPAWRQEAAEAGLLAYAASRVGEVENDDREDWTEAWRLSPSEVAYIWHAGRHASRIQSHLEAADFVIRSQIIWAKRHFPISRGDYHWRHEPCWYAVRKGGKAEWVGDRKQTTVWDDITLDKNVEGGHSTQKPVELMARSIRNHLGDVYDPFVGSGTTLVAAHAAGRTCFAMEVKPAYCDVVLTRFQAVTGVKPVRVSDGQTVDFTLDKP